MLTFAYFVQHLRDALASLYDLDKLAANPLLDVLDVHLEQRSPVALRHLLVDAIKRLRPSDDTPIDSPPWRTYELLSQRYVQQLTQREVADQIGLSTRHVRREQEMAIEELARQLWEEFGISDDRHENADRGHAQEQTAVLSLDAELAWLGDDSQWQSTTIRPVVDAILPLIRPLAAEADVEIQTILPDEIPQFAVHPMALRQMLLTLVSVAIRSARGGKVTVSSDTRGWDGVLTVVPSSRRPGPNPLHDEDAADLEIVDHLAQMFGGALDCAGPEKHAGRSLRLPLAAQVPILVIDDSSDNLRLLSRYVAGTRYRLIETQRSDQALELIRTSGPRAIVMDVIMPTVDGWELLQELVNDPSTKSIPVILCTVLSQRDLALALGAQELLTKPIGRATFLSALDRVLSARGSESG